MSITIPELTGVRLTAGAEPSSVNIALFRTTGVVVVRSAGASENRSQFERVSMREDNGEASASLKSGGWKAMTDTLPAEFRRASTRGDAAGAGEVTYEIWGF